MVLNRAAKIPRHAPLNSMDYDSFWDFSGECLGLATRMPTTLQAIGSCFYSSTSAMDLRTRAVKPFSERVALCVPTSLQRRIYTFMGAARGTHVVGG